MEIKQSLKESYTGKELYKLTKSPEIELFKNHVGEYITIDDYLIYTEQDGEKTSTVTVVKDVEKGTFLSNSSTVAKSLSDIVSMFTVDDFLKGDVVIKIISRESKQGRTYINVVLD